MSRRNFSKTQFVSVDNLTRKMERTSEKFNPTSISLVNTEDKGIFFQLDKCIDKQNLLVLMRLFSCLMDLSVSNAHVVINNFQKNIYNLAKSTDVKNSTCFALIDLKFISRNRLPLNFIYLP